VRPAGREHYQLVAGERRWRAAQLAGLVAIPALIEELDDDAALEIAVIENLQREDLSPLEEANMYEKMVTEHGYSIRKLAQKLGKDKGYLENRLRLADAPEEIRALVSVRKDTISHAYELMKVQDPRKRRRLAAQVASGQLSLVKLRERIEGRPRRVADPDAAPEQAIAWPGEVDEDDRIPPPATVPTGDDALIVAKASFQEALGELLAVLQSAEFAEAASATDRQNLAKYLTISKLTLENAITVVRGRGD
jgi:ParB/RepB/Spo0J family partition protein